MGVVDQQQEEKTGHLSVQYSNRSSTSMEKGVLTFVRDVSKHYGAAYLHHKWKEQIPGRLRVSDTESNMGAAGRHLCVIGFDVGR